MRRGRVRAALALPFLLLCVWLLPPVQAQAAVAPPEVEAGAYLLMDAATGQVLAAKNPDMISYPASITKIFTEALILEQAAERPGFLDEQALTSYRATHELIYGATHVGLREGDVFNLRDLLYATQIESANDAANVLAEHSDGSLEGFAARMNAKAAELGLTTSQFTNPSGQPDENHYTTAYDMAAITRWALGVPGFRELFAATEYPLPPTATRDYVFTCKNNNSILSPASGSYYEGVTGSKMGYTDDARYTLVSTARRGDVELICVVLRCETGPAKYTSTTALFDYGFGNFTPASYPAGKMDPVTVPVFGGGTKVLGEISVLGGGDIPFLLPSGLSLDNVSAEAVVPEKYVIGQPFAPVMRLTLDDGTGPVELLRAPLSWTGFDEVFAANTSAWQRAMEKYPPTLMILTLVVLGLAGLVLGRIAYVRVRRRRRRQARLEAIRARQPIRLAPRPPAARQEAAPPARQSGAGRARQTAASAQSRTPYVYGTAAAQPRRVGRQIKI